MAIDELGAELSRRSEQKGIDRREEDRRRRRKDMLRQFAGQAVMGGVKNFMETRQAKNAFNFMQREPIIAARAKFNQAVDAGIQQRTNWAESMAHANGQRGWMYDRVNPQIREDLLKTIDEEDYTKDGFDALVDKETYDYIDKVAMPAFLRANDAANRMTDDKTAFDKFVQINDGIPDNIGGTIFKGIGNIFRGKDKVALKQEAIAASLGQSKFVKKAETMNLAMSAMNKGYSVKKATDYARQLDKHLMNDDDFKYESQEPDTITVKLFGKDMTIRGRKVTTKNSWGKPKTVFVPDDGQGVEELSKKITLQTASEPATIDGITYNKQTIRAIDGFGNDKGIVGVEFIPLNVDPSVSNIPDATTDNYLQDFYLRANNAVSEIGSTETFLGIGSGEVIDRYMSRSNDLEGIQETDRLARARATGRSLITQANKLKLSSNIYDTEKYPRHSDNLAEVLVQESVINDIRRMLEPTTFDNQNLEFSRGFRDDSNQNSVYQILEAVATLRESQPNIDIEETWVKDYVTQTQTISFRDEDGNLKRFQKPIIIKEIEQMEQRSDGNQLDVIMQILNAEQNNRYYAHFFTPYDVLDGNTLFDLFNHGFQRQQKLRASK